MNNDNYRIKLLKVKELSECLSISTTTIWRWTKSGILPPPISINNSIFWKEETIKNWIEAQENGE